MLKYQHLLSLGSMSNVKVGLFSGNSTTMDELFGRKVGIEYSLARPPTGSLMNVPNMCCRNLEARYVFGLVGAAGSVFMSSYVPISMPMSATLRQQDPYTYGKHLGVVLDVPA